MNAFSNNLNGTGDMPQSQGNFGSGMDWLKVSELSAGMQIAVPRAGCFADFGAALADDSVLEAGGGDVLWDEIEEIRELPEEQVWDIEVEGTHNFVAGHLVDKKTGNQLSEEEEAGWLNRQSESAAKERPSRNGLDAWFGALFAHNTYLDGDVGIGTSTPGHMLHIGSSANPGDVMIANGALCVDNNDACAGALTAGSVYAVGAYSQTADYAEYFYSNDLDLESGEVVCVDVAQNNAVKRCTNGADGNIMGIVSTAPAFTGNATDETRNNPHYKIIGMLGQLPTKASSENGPIRPGDSLTSSATLPGYAMKALAGDSTVGVALEALSGDSGVINVLVSRRNKSLTVEQVESAVVDRIAAMEIEDEVALLVSDAVGGYDFDPVVTDIIGTELALLEQDFNLRLSGEISQLRDLIAANKLKLITESSGLVAVNTNLTVAGDLKAEGGITVSLRGGPHASLGVNSLADAAISSSTPPAFRVATDGTVTAFNDFIISDGVTATSVRETLTALSAETMVKTQLTVRQDLYAGNSFEVMGSQVAGASVQRPVFRIASDGTVTVRDDLVLSGYTAWNDIPGIVSVFAYNTASDLDGGAWTAGSRSASWYNEPLDASAEACDLAANDRCGSRSFPQQAIIAATTNTVYIFNAQDGSLWKKLMSASLRGEAEAIPSLSGITTLYAADGALYLAQAGIVSIIDFKNDGIASLGSTLTRNDRITGIHVQKINGEIYLAIAGDAGIDLINLADEADESASHTETSPASNEEGAREWSAVRLTAAGDLYATATSTLSVFARAYNQDELIPSATHTASSTLQGLYVTQDGNTAYTASGSRVIVIPAPAFAGINSSGIQGQSEGVQEFETGTVITSFTVDEQAQVIYAATEGGVKALALGDGSVLATYESGEDSTGAPWTLSGAVQVASLTGFGPTREGELLSDTLVIATPNGLLAQSADVSVRASLASGLSGFGSRARSGRLSVTDEALFSGRIAVTDSQNRPVFSIDEETGNAFIREDVRFGGHAALRAVAGAKDAFVYDTAQDADGGAWRARAAFPARAMLIAGEEGVHVFDAASNRLVSVIDDVPSPSFVRAQDGMLAIADESGITLVDLAGGEAPRSIPTASAINGLAFANIRGALYAALATDGGALLINIQTNAMDAYAADAPVASIALSERGKLYYATRTEAYAAGESLGASEQLPGNGFISGIALSKDTLYIAHDSGIAALNLATDTVTLLDGLGAPESVSVMDTGELLITGEYQGAAAVIKATTGGAIVDVWTANEERADDAGVAYGAEVVRAAHARGDAIAIAAETGAGEPFAWLASSGFSLREELNAPKTVFTVIDRIQTPRIASVSSLSFTASSTISFYAGATSTPALVIRDNGDISTSGKVGIGTTTPEYMLDVAGDARFSSIRSSEASLGTTTASELRIQDGYLQLRPVSGAPRGEDCDSALEYGRMAFDSQSETLYLCGPAGFRAFSPDPTTAPE